MPALSSALRAAFASATSRWMIPRPSLVTAHKPSMLIPALPRASPRSAKVPGRSSRETVRSFIGTSFRGPSRWFTPTASRRQTAGSGSGAERRAQRRRVVRGEHHPRTGRHVAGGEVHAGVRDRLGELGQLTGTILARDVDDHGLALALDRDPRPLERGPSGPAVLDQQVDVAVAAAPEPRDALDVHPGRTERLRGVRETARLVGE